MKHNDNEQFSTGNWSSNSSPADDTLFDKIVAFERSITSTHILVVIGFVMIACFVLAFTSNSPIEGASLILCAGC